MTAPMTVAGHESTRVLLAGIVDYAGLFPPAALGMPSAVAAYERYRQGEHAWMLGAFVVPAARLGEMAAALGAPSDGAPWPISILVSSSDEARRALEDARERWSDRLDVRAVEFAVQDPKLICRSAAKDDPCMRVIHEVPLDDLQEARLDAIAEVGAVAKVRTGGVTPAAFPHPVLLADFVRSCAERAIPFKATAGLHHAVRGRHPLTYRPRSPRCEMFGFLDVALVAALLWFRRADTQDAGSLLGDSRAPVLAEPDALSWAGYRLSVIELEEARRRFFLSFGSCSFEEPVAELTGLGLL